MNEHDVLSERIKNIDNLIEFVMKRKKILSETLKSVNEDCYSKYYIPDDKTTIIDCCFEHQKYLILKLKYKILPASCCGETIVYDIVERVLGEKDVLNIMSFEYSLNTEVLSIIKRYYIADQGLDIKNLRGSEAILYLLNLKSIPNIELDFNEVTDGKLYICVNYFLSKMLEFGLSFDDFAFQEIIIPHTDRTQMINIYERYPNLIKSNVSKELDVFFDEVISLKRELIHRISCHAPLCLVCLFVARIERYVSEKIASLTKNYPSLIL